jgi:uncharacterized protein (DUF305 family)
MRTTLLAALLVPLVMATAGFPALAQPPAEHPSAPMHGMAMGRPDAAASPSSKAFRAADEKMMHDMMRPMSGDADRDFVAGMIPHHQGAVEMAKIELQYGKDPAMRRLATNIVNSQEKEIREMKAWQARHAAPE